MIRFTIPPVGLQSKSKVSLRTREELSRRHTKEEPTTGGRVVFAVRNQSYRLIAFTACKWGIPLCILHINVRIYFMKFVQYIGTFILAIYVRV